MKRLTAASALCAVFLVSCSSGANTSLATASVTVVTTLPAEAPTTVPTETPVSAPVSAAVTPTVTAPPVATGITQISVTVGKNGAPDRIEKVKLGATVQLAVINPSADDEFHLHGYDLEQATKAGEQGIISFVADKAGSFELESHVTNKPLLTLVVA